MEERSRVRGVGNERSVPSDRSTVRESILEEATRLMAARGFDGTSLQAVADAVGVKKPSVLYHFPSKDELRKAVLDRLLARWSDVLPKLLMASARAGLAKFDAVISELMEFFATDPDRARLLVRELLDQPDKKAIEGYVRPWIEVVGSYIRKGQESGQIQKEVDPEAYVLLVANLLLSGIANAECVTSVLPAEEEEPDEDEAGGPVRRAGKELVRMARASLFTTSYLNHKVQEGQMSRGTKSSKDEKETKGVD